MEIGNTDVLASDFSVRRFQEADSNRSELGQEDFLQLIVAQIQNQDPFDPVDNGEFIADLAQFSSVDGINNLNDSFAEFTQNFFSSQALNSASLIGKSVLTEGNQLNVSEGEPVEAFVDAGGQVGTADVQITNTAGELVHTLQVPLTNAGLNQVTWNGLDSNGEPVPEGSYFISASVLAGETDLALSTTVKNKIQSVNLTNANANSIELGLASGATIFFDEVTQISQ